MMHRSLKHTMHRYLKDQNKYKKILRCFFMTKTKMMHHSFKDPKQMMHQFLKKTKKIKINTKVVFS